MASSSAQAQRRQRRCDLAWRMLAWVILVVLVAGNLAIWWPLWKHWHVAVDALEPATIEAHRRLPEDHVLAMVAEMSMTTDHPGDVPRPVGTGGGLIHLTRLA